MIKVTPLMESVEDVRGLRIALRQAARRQDRLDELVGDSGRYLRVLIVKCALAELDGFFIAGEVLPAVDAQGQVLIEPRS